MNIKRRLTGLLWLLVSPLVAALDSPADAEWRPSIPANAPQAFAAPHLYTERLHERWVPDSIDWSRPREIAINLVCELGLIALALIDCNRLVADGQVAESVGVLILLPPASRPAGGGAGGPDFHDVRRRSIEERMQSI